MLAGEQRASIWGEKEKDPFHPEREREGTTEKKDYPSLLRPSVTSVRRLGRKVGQAGAGEGPTEANETAKQRKWRGREKNERAEGAVTCGG